MSFFQFQLCSFTGRLSKIGYWAGIFVVGLALFGMSVAFANVQSLRPWMGVQIDKGAKGVLVLAAIPESPAFQAGLSKGDEIFAVAGVKVATPEELIKTVVAKGVGHTVKVEFWRQGKQESRELTLVAMPDMVEMAKKKLVNQSVPLFESKVVEAPKGIKGVKGKKFSMKEQIGRVTVLEFWATWCVACVGAHPRLAEFSLQNKGKIDVVAISAEKPEIIGKFLGQVKKLAGHPKGQMAYLSAEEEKVNGQFMASAIPMFVLVDKSGVVSAVELGGGSGLENLLSQAISLLK